MTRGRGSSRRRGLVLAEAGIVYTVALLLVMGMIIVGLGVFRYQEVAFQARQGARWASVQSGTPTSAQLLSQGISTFALQSSKLTATVGKTTINSVDYITVTLNYQWAPEAFPSLLSPVTFTSTSRQPITP